MPWHFILMLPGARRINIMRILIKKACFIKWMIRMKGCTMRLVVMECSSEKTKVSIIKEMIRVALTRVFMTRADLIIIKILISTHIRRVTASARMESNSMPVKYIKRQCWRLVTEPWIEILHLQTGWKEFYLSIAITMCGNLVNISKVPSSQSIMFSKLDVLNSIKWK